MTIYRDQTQVSCIQVNSLPCEPPGKNGETLSKSQVVLVVKNPATSAGDSRDMGQVGSLGWEDPLEKKWLPTPVFLPGEFHEQRSLVGYNPWGHKESYVTEQLTLSLSAGPRHCATNFSLSW